MDPLWDREDVRPTWLTGTYARVLRFDWYADAHLFSNGLSHRGAALARR